MRSELWYHSSMYFNSRAFPDVCILSRACKVTAPPLRVYGRMCAGDHGHRQFFQYSAVLSSRQLHTTREVRCITETIIRLVIFQLTRGNLALVICFCLESVSDDHCLDILQPDSRNVVYTTRFMYLSEAAAFWSHEVERC